MCDSISDQDRAFDHSNEDLSTKFRAAQDSLTHCASQAMQDGSDYVRQNTIPVLCSAFGLGLLAGSLLFGRAPRSRTDRYLLDPLNESKGALLALLAASGALMQGQLGKGRKAASELSEKVGTNLQETLKPLSKAAQKKAHKLGL